MALTLEDLATDDLSADGGPAAGNLCKVATASAGAFTALSTGDVIAIGPPSSLIVGGASAGAMRTLAWFLERAWKWQEINGVDKRFIEKRETEVSSDDDYGSGRPEKQLLTTYTIRFFCKTDAVNDLMISNMQDLT